MTEHTTDTSNETKSDGEVTHHTTIIERDSKSSSGSGMVMAVILLIAVVIGGVFAFQYLQQGQIETEAISEAAGSVGDAAEQVGDAAQDAADSLNGG